MTGLLEPTIKETYQGRAEVTRDLPHSEGGDDCGMLVSPTASSSATPKCACCATTTVVFTGKVGSLRRFKDDASEVRNGMECGISISNYGDIKVGDVIEAFVTEKVAAEAMA